MVTQIFASVVLAAGMAGALLAAIERARRAAVAVLGALVAAVSVVAWAVILRATDNVGAFTDEPALYAFPVIWQDLGSGVLALVLASLVFSLGPLRAVPVRRVVPLTLITAGSAQLVYIYVF